MHGLNLELFDSQITAILGHNGAGKTTLISALTGLIDSSGGEAWVRGLSLRYDMDEVRQHYGICPQHDVLFPLLTVEEHLHLFASLRAWPYDTIELHITQMIADVGLTEKRHTFAQDLSGGMRRKLSVAIAFIGGSNIVFLDEPTSGMDPYSRRSTWNLLRKLTPGRTLILTTHFMEEAELLADRIAIMSEGHLLCCGSCLYLKARHGLGYTLTLTRAAEMECDVDAIQAMLKESVPQVNTLSIAAGEIAFQLPLDSVSLFPRMFDRLERDCGRLGVGSYGISMTTLEDVFLRIESGVPGSSTCSALNSQMLPPSNVVKLGVITGCGGTIADLPSSSWPRVIAVQHVRSLHTSSGMILF